MGESRAGDTDGDQIEVLEANWPAVRVYLACEWTMHIGWGVVYYQGISAQEAIAAMQVTGIRRSAWQDTLRRVRIMVDAARELRNKTKT